MKRQKEYDELRTLIEFVKEFKNNSLPLTGEVQAIEELKKLFTPGELRNLENALILKRKMYEKRYNLINKKESRLKEIVSTCFSTKNEVSK